MDKNDGGKFIVLTTLMMVINAILIILINIIYGVDERSQLETLELELEEEKRKRDEMLKTLEKNNKL